MRNDEWESDEWTVWDDLAVALESLKTATNDLAEIWASPPLRPLKRLQIGTARHFRTIIASYKGGRAEER